MYFFNSLYDVMYEDFGGVYIDVDGIVCKYLNR